VTPRVWKVMNLIFFGSLLGGFGFGYVVGDKSVGCGVAGSAFALMIFFIGAMTAMLKTWFDYKSMMTHYEAAIEDVKKTSREAVAEHRRDCAEAMVSLSKASVTRVVDRVLAEHPVLATNLEQLEAAKEDARLIVDQELMALEDAVADEASQHL